MDVLESGWRLSLNGIMDTANKFMHVANQFGSVEMSKISTFDLSALYQLAAPSTPEAAREEAISRARAGESITHKAAKSLKQKYAIPPKPKPELILEPQPQSLQTPPIPAPLTQSHSKLEVVAFRPKTQASATPQPGWSHSKPGWSYCFRFTSR